MNTVPTTDGAERLSTTILRTIHQTDAGFRIARARRDDTGKEIVMLGTFPLPIAGERLLVTGAWESSPKYGNQFRVEHAEVTQPTTEEGLVECLSRLIDGVGPGLARRYVRTLGGVARTIEFLDSTNLPLRHDEVMLVDGHPVTDKASAHLFAMRDAWQARTAENATELGLASLGLSPAQRHRLRARYGTEAVTVCRTRPYELAFEVDGFGFKRADEVALAAGLDRDSRARREAALVHVLKEEAGSAGHVFCGPDQARAMVERLCEMPITLEQIQEAARALEHRGAVVVGASGSIGLRHLIEAEEEIAERLADRLARPSVVLAEVSIEAAEQASALNLTNEQRHALSTVRFCDTSIVTGGPGVGKSTTTRAVCSLFELAGLRFRLAAPTGRAARRLAEATGREATTIHRLLAYDPKKGGFTYDEHEPLPIDALLLDECSMIDVELLRSVLRALPLACRLVFVGDADQLPPVGPGAPFRDLVESNALAIARLETVHRQAAGSRIVGASREVLAGTAPTASASGDRSDGALFIVEEADAGALARMVVDLAAGGLAESFPWLQPGDVQIVSPQRRGSLGVGELNDAIQAVVNPRPAEERYEAKRSDGGGSDETKSRTIRFHVGDRVMQTKNDYQRGVVNGELGIVAEMLEHGEKASAPVLSVRFVDGTEERIVEYTKKDLRHLDLAYATTVHKVQGAEFPAVIVVCHGDHRYMLDRSLVYTALTRAKKLCVLVGTKKAIARGVRAARGDARRTTLRARMEAK